MSGRALTGPVEEVTGPGETVGRKYAPFGPRFGVIQYKATGVAGSALTVCCAPLGRQKAREGPADWAPPS